MYQPLQSKEKVIMQVPNMYALIFCPNHLRIPILLRKISKPLTAETHRKNHPLYTETGKNWRRTKIIK